MDASSKEHAGTELLHVPIETESGIVLDVRVPLPPELPLSDALAVSAGLTAFASVVGGGEAC